MDWSRLSNPLFSRSAYEADLEKLGVRSWSDEPNVVTIIFPSKPTDELIRRVDVVIEKHDGREQQWTDPEWSDFYDAWIVDYYAFVDEDEED